MHVRIPQENKTSFVISISLKHGIVLGMCFLVVDMSKHTSYYSLLIAAVYSMKCLYDSLENFCCHIVVDNGLYPITCVLNKH